jgi:exosome complex component RRP41
MKRDRRLLEISAAIKNIFEAVVSTTTAPRSEIDVYIQILQIDGGMIHTAINGTTLALIDAGIPMSDYVCACSAGFANDNAILDLNFIEENADVPTMTVALLPKSGKVTMSGVKHPSLMIFFPLFLLLTFTFFLSLHNNSWRLG